MPFAVTVTSTKLILSENGIQIRFAGMDIIRANAGTAPRPNLSTGPVSAYVDLLLTGDSREVFGEKYTLWMDDVSNQPTWTNDIAGAQQAAADIAVMIRSAPSGGGGGQVDTIVAGDAIDVDATDPVNPIVDVRVDGVTIGINGLNQLEVPAGGGGYVPTSRTISTTSPLTGGGDLSANRTFAIPQANGSTNGYLSSGDWTTFNNKGDVSGPASAVDDDIALFNGISGKDIKSAGINLTEVVEPFGLGDVSLFHSTGVSPIILRDVNDGDGTSVQANTGSFQINARVQNSIERDTGTNRLQLVGDAASPGNRKRYGTNASGVKGWYDTDVSDLTGLGTGVSTALGQNANSANGFVTQAGGDARYLLASNEIIGSLTSTQSTSSTSLVDCTGLSVSVEAGATYQIEGFILFQSTAITNGISLSLNGPAAPTEFAANIVASRTQTASSNNNINAYDQTTNSADVIAANTTQFALINGAMINGANAGDLIVRFASEAGTQTVRIMAGSSLRLRKIS